MVECLIRFFVSAKRRDAAERVAARTMEIAELTATASEWRPYEKIGGWVGTFRWFVDRPDDEWPLTVFDLLAVAQRIGHGWTMSGRIEEGLDLSTDRPAGRGAGMRMITLQALRTEQGVPGDE
jgi:hypothetical protein